MARRVKVERTVEVDVLELANGATLDEHPGGGYIHRAANGLQVRLQEGGSGEWIASVVNGPALTARGPTEDVALERLAASAALLASATAGFAPGGPGNGNGGGPPGASNATEAPGKAKKA